MEKLMSLQKIIVITGASSGIGAATAQRLASEKSHIIMLAKTSEQTQKTCEDIIAVGGMATFIDTHLNDNNSITTSIAHIMASHTHVDAYIHCASLVHIKPHESSDIQTYQDMLQINSLSFYNIFHQLLPLLTASPHPHVLALAPPITFEPEDLSRHLAYKTTRYLTSMMISGLSCAFPMVHVNAIWPKGYIQSPDKCHIIKNYFSPTSSPKKSPFIVADAIVHILHSKESSGEFYIDEDVLAEHGIHDLSPYILADHTTT